MFKDEFDMDDLNSAEEFLDYFDIAFDASVVHVNRLHILQRFHDYMKSATQPDDENGRRRQYQSLLKKAYEDFVNSDAKTEKVFKVFKMNEPKQVFVSFK